MWRKSGTKLQERYPATPSGGFMLGLDEFVYLAKSNLNLTIWLVQMHSKLASLVRNNIWTCQIVKFALDFAKNTNPSRPSINPPVVVAGSVLIYIKHRVLIYYSFCEFRSQLLFIWVLPFSLSEFSWALLLKAQLPNYLKNHCHGSEPFLWLV